MSDTITMPQLDELTGKIEAKQSELGRIFDEAGPEVDLSKVTSISGDTYAKAEAIRSLNDELTDLGKQRDQLDAVRRAAEGVRTAGAAGTDVSKAAAGEHGAEPGTPAHQRQVKSFGDLFTGSKAYSGRNGSVGPEVKLDFEVKTLFETGAGWEPETTRTGRVVPYAARPVQVTDLIPVTTTTQAAVVFMEETTGPDETPVTGTPPAGDGGEVAEGGTYPETQLALTERSSPVRKIAVYIPVTDEQLEDEPQVRGYLDNRLPFMLRQRLDRQILVGDGDAPNLRGVLNTPGILTRAKGADEPAPDAIYRAVTAVRVDGQAMANAVIMHPLDWQDIRLLRTADGIYIWGNPSDAGPERIWGLQVTQAQALAENTALVGDFANFSELAIRRGMDVQISNSHANFFIDGKQAVRADTRAAFVIYRPSAFCTVTGV